MSAETIGQLPRFHSLASVTLDGEISRPFRLGGVPVEDLFPDECHPEDLPALDAAIDGNLGRAPIAETLDRLDRHPQEIVKHLAAARRQQPGRASGGRQTLDTGSGEMTAAEQLAADASARPPSRCSKASTSTGCSRPRRSTSCTRPAASRRWAQAQLALLREVGLADLGLRCRGAGWLWHLTERGVDAAATIPSRAETRRKVISPEQAAGPLQAHTIAVNDVGLCLRAGGPRARRRVRPVRLAP